MTVQHVKCTIDGMWCNYPECLVWANDQSSNKSSFCPRDPRRQEGGENPPEQPPTPEPQPS